MQLTTQNIINFQSDGDLKRLSVFIKLKQLYANSCIYGYNIKKLSSKSQLSRHIIRKNISFFLKEGWCYMHGKNLMFRKWNDKKIIDNDFIIKNRSIFKDKTIKEIEIILLSTILKKKNDNYNWCQKNIQDLENSKLSDFPITVKKYKQLLRAKRKYRFKSECNGSFKMTMNTIGEMFSCSKSKASDLIGKMEVLGLVRVGRYYPKFIGHCSASKMKSLEGLRGVFGLPKKNMMFYKQCNEYAFL